MESFINFIINSELKNICIINFISEILTCIINIYLITNLIKIGVNKSKTAKIIVLTFFIQVFSILLIITPYHEFINIIFMIILIRITVKINIEKNIKVKDLESYNKTLELMVDSVKSFRHDYGNFLQALNGYTQTNNIDGVKSIVNSALKECINVNNMGILKPETINNSAVYSILTNKYYLALEHNVSMNIEVKTDIKSMQICDYEFCKILGILLDNAIEAAIESDEKIVNVKFKKDNRINRNLVIVENSYEKINIDIDKIFEKGYTTKNDTRKDHGLGLWTIRKILNHSDNLNLFTSKSNLFSQQLEIYEK